MNRLFRKKDYHDPGAGALPLEFVVVKADGLAAADSNGLSDPYVKVSLRASHDGAPVVPGPPKNARPGKSSPASSGHWSATLKTKVVKRTLQPVWNESLVIRVPAVGGGPDPLTLFILLDVMDDDMLRDDDIGAAILPLWAVRDASAGYTTPVSLPVWHYPEGGRMAQHGTVTVRVQPPVPALVSALDAAANAAAGRGLRWVSATAGQWQPPAPPTGWSQPPDVSRSLGGAAPYPSAGLPGVPTGPDPSAPPYPSAGLPPGPEIGRASCRERV
eukprot:TRINITY_DN56998_c0_g1_i1.p1 TRINITY_DN56998_c0_g1~~TRINITY_DN56998_c0_g1_i1.p1  ORF type:complete len:273 (+),score=29.49 TRINITY_DN56998_c0_g1_i1:172-990(+)